MAKDSFNVGVIGLGTVGTGVARILLENAENIGRRAGIPIRLARAADLDIARDRGLDFPEGVLVSDAGAVLDDPEIDVVVEVIGGVSPARTFIETALGNGKHVVTSNKEVVAKHGRGFLELARSNGVNLYYEAAVGGGIPIVHALKNCLAANEIEQVFGIMNGTTNYILTKMHEERAEFESVLKEAQELGYAEADPTADVDGYDVAYKLAILAGIAFNAHFSYEDIYFEGIRKISGEDVRIAEEMGYAIKLLAIGIRREGGVELRVHPAMIDRHHPLAAIEGSFNAVYVKGNYVNETMFYGPGAGALPTASAVVGDVIDLAMSRGVAGSHPSITTGFNDLPVLPKGDIRSQYSLRLRVKDQLGVLASVGEICRDAKVSLRSVNQHTVSRTEAEIVLVTHTVREEAMQRALAEIRGLETVLEVQNLIRVGL